MLKWARTNGCPWALFTCSSAARAAISQCYSGHVLMAAHGMSTPVIMLLNMVISLLKAAILSCYNGRAPTGAPGMSSPATMLQKVITLRCYSG